MNWKAFLAFVALVVLFAAGIGLLMFVRRPSAMTFFFTADTQGYLVPCGCKVVPAGGLARRATVLDALRKGGGEERVVPVEVTHGFADRGPGRALLNGEMGRFFAREGYLVGLGSYDLLLGLPALRAAAPGVPLYLAGEPGLAGSKEFRLGGWGLGPFGGKGARLRVIFLAETAPGGVSIGDPLKALRAEMAAHPAEGTIVVGQLSPQTLTKVVEVQPAPLLVVAQWQTDVTSMPQAVGSHWVLYMGDRGRRSATAKVEWTGKAFNVLPTIRYLGPEVASEPSVSREVAQVLDQVAAVNKAALAKLSRPAAPGRAYVGSAGCKTCHAEAHKRWSLSSHARATADLAIDHQQQNPACLKCHATALGEPGGYPQASVDLAGVGCEACHGPGQGHPGRPMEVQPAGPQACGACHTPRDSPMFDAAGYWKLIEHK